LNHKSYASLSGLLFLAIAALHLTRIVYGWEATLNGYSMPNWASWLGVIVAGCLAYHGLKLAKN